MRRLPLRTSILAAALAVTHVSPAAADLWYEHYQKGEQAMNAQYWAEAIQQLTQAIEKRGDPGVAVQTYGKNVINYHPYLKLGIAYFNVGQFDAALQALDTEEKAGAIARSRSDLQNLQTFRRLAQEGITSAVAESLKEAEVWERKGQMGKAMAALGRGLAVDRENAQVLAAMRRLSEMVAVRDRESELESRVTRLIGQARRLISEGKYARASANLKHVLMLKPGAEVNTLMEEAQEKLRQELESSLDRNARRVLSKEGVEQAALLEARNRPDEALEKIQSVLAVDAKNQQAMVMQYRLVKAAADAENLRSRTEEVARLLAEGEDLLRKGMYEKSVAAINRAMALDPDNASARSALWRAFRAMHQAIPAAAKETPAPKLPPIIALANTANAVDEDERRYQKVSSSDFVLRGVILSDQPRIAVAFHQAPEERGTEEQVAQVTDLAGELMGTLYQYHFDQAFRLPQAAAKLRVSVVDPQGLISEVVYRVRYVRPLSRSPWMYPAFALAGLSVLGGVQGYRMHRRNRLRKRRFNPFVAGAPVLNEDIFLGREALLSRILQTVHNNSILLYGERRIGKTSLQHHLKRRLEQLRDPEYDFYPVYIDLEGTPQERFFARLAEDIFEGLSPVLNGARPGQGLQEGASYSYEAFVRDVREVLKTLKKRSTKRIKLVLLIDEVDELNNYDPRVNQRLRSLFMKSFAEDLVAVVSGVGISKHWASEGSPWYNFFEEIEVKPFTRKDAEDLIQRPVRGIFKLDKGAVDRIIENTDAKPYLIQKLCVALINRMHDQNRRKITVADVDAIGRPTEAG